MKSWLLVAAAAGLIGVVLLAHGGAALETCAPQKCQKCNGTVSCHCPSSGETHKAPCRSSYVDYFDGRNGEAICAPATRLQKHLDCSKNDSRFSFDEARVKRVNGTMLCSDLMKHGCVQFSTLGLARGLKCWCESLGEVILMNKYGFHLNIYSGHTGELLCPLAPQPGDCTTCGCEETFTVAPNAPTLAAPTATTPPAPTRATTTSRSSETVSSEPTAAEQSTPATPKTTQPPTIESATPAAGWEGVCALLVGALCVGAFLAAGVVALCAALIIDSRQAHNSPSTL